MAETFSTDDRGLRCLVGLSITLPDVAVEIHVVQKCPNEAAATHDVLIPSDDRLCQKSKHFVEALKPFSRRDYLLFQLVRSLVIHRSELRVAGVLEEGLDARKERQGILLNVLEVSRGKRVELVLTFLVEIPEIASTAESIRSYRVCGSMERSDHIREILRIESKRRIDRIKAKVLPDVGL